MIYNKRKKLIDAMQLLSVKPLGFDIGGGGATFPLPKANGGNFTVDENGSISGDLSQTDGIGNPATTNWVFFSPPQHGDLVGNGATGQWTYTPDLDYVGTDFFEYAIIDDREIGDVASVSFTVEAVVAPVVQRNFTYLEESANMHYSILKGDTLTGDFEIEIKYVPAATKDFHGVVCGEVDGTSDTWRFVLSGTNRPDANSNRLAIVTPAATYGESEVLNGFEGDLSSSVFGREGIVYYLTLNGVEVFRRAASSIEPLNITALGVYADYSTNSYQGIISDLKVTSEGTLLTDTPLDDDWSDTNVARDLLSSYGSELFTDSETNASPSWSVLSDGSVIKNGTDSSTQYIGSVESGKTYALTFLKESHEVGTPNFRDDTGNQYIFPVLNPLQDSGRIYTHIFTATRDGLVGFNGNSATFVLRDVSLKEVTSGWVTVANNITSGDSLGYTEDGTAWVSDPFLSIAELTIDEDGSWTNVYEINGLDNMNSYILTADVVVDSGALSVVNSVPSEGTNIISTSGEVSMEFKTYTATDIVLQSRGSGFTGTLSNIELRHKMEEN